MSNSIATIARKASFSPKIRSVGKAVIRGTPFAAVYGIGVALYHYSPEFKTIADDTRSFMNEYPVASETAVSALLRGAIPDLIAHGFKNFNFRRFNLMTGFGAFLGGVVQPYFYNDVQPALFPESGLVSLGRTIAFDQGVYTPFFFFPLFFSFVNFVEQKPWQGFLRILWHKTVNILPLNWAVWTFGCALIYSAPADLMVHISSFLSLAWFVVLSDRSFGKKEGEL